MSRQQTVQELSGGQKTKRALFRGVAWLVSLVSIPLGGWIWSNAPRKPAPGHPEVLRASDEDLLWLEKAQEARLAQLEQTRTAAKDWASTITAVTGAVGIIALIKGPEEIGRLTHDWEVAVGVVLLVAVLLALRGIVLAAVAAQGTPRSFTYSAAGYREHYFHELGLAAAALRVSRICVVLSTLALIAGVGMTWYGKEGKTKTTQVFAVLRVGSPVCGELTADKAGGLEVKDADGKLTRLRTEDVLAIVPASTCP